MEYVNSASSEAISLLENFWPRVTDEIQNLTSSDFKNPELPLARIKKIMKLDDEVKMISAEAPIIFAKAAELFIQEVTIRAWLHTEENKRRTLQKNDITLAISKYDEFDFLIDIVPREEKKPTTKKESHSPTGQQSSTTNQTQSNQNVMNVINHTDQSTASLLNALNNNGTVSNTILTSGANGNIVNTGSPGNNVQYYFALPNGLQNGNSLPLQLQNLSGIQNIQGLPNNLQNIQTIQGLQGLQGLQGAQIILNSNGQPTIFVGNRDCT